ncbi:helix-hairpin-helix domain-containing protein [Micromonospora sp. CPCC 205546]|uniref:helix-hairpin-helix domain-containing protein n=1 Tax=Micromonospora sp. CPCC 205546 TaxID=3122397 RepID=UPI003FA5DA88
MAWSFGHWLILIVALVVGVAGGWFWRGRQDAAAATHDSPMVDGDPVAGMTAVVVDPPPVATLDEERPAATVDHAPDAVADRVPAAPGAEAPADADPATAAPATVVTADASRTDEVDPADMALTDDPVPAPETDPAPQHTATDARPDHELVLPVAAEVTGPVDRRPAQEPTAATEPQDVPTATAQPVPAAVTPSPASAPLTPTEPESLPTAASPVEPEPADIPAEPEPTRATPIEPEPTRAILEEPTRTTPVEPAPAAATADEPVTAVGAPAEPEQTPAEVPAEPVVVPSPRGEVTTPDASDSDAADDFRRIQGVGPKMAAALQAAGIRTYRQLAELDEAALRETIRAAGLRGAPSLATWPQQAKVLAGAPQEAATALPAPVGGTDA